MFGRQRGKAFLASGACRRRRRESKKQGSERDCKVGVEEGVELSAARKVMVQSADLCRDENLKPEG